jgi:UDP-N-acetylglucosamine 2-epimerase (non-hydrolysing)
LFPDRRKDSGALSASANLNPLIAIIVGTRPEAIKMAPVVRAMRARPGATVQLVSTGQHTDLLRPALDAFGLVPDHELDVMTANQSLGGTAAKIIDRGTRLFEEIKPNAVLVQGDTTTAFAAGLAAYYLKIPVGHVEAGLRTYDFDNPFPEEANRQMVDRISTWCFPPTESSKANLLAERIDPRRIHVTGNTGIDALLWALERSPVASDRKPYVLMTLHRRESFGEPLEDILHGVRDFLETTPGATVVWPMHPNPNVARTADRVLGDHPRVERIPPQDYLAFAGLMAASRVILSDSGGVQEEAPSLGRRVLIARETTERPEAVTAGQNRLIGRTREAIHRELNRAWSVNDQLTSNQNPYGDGRASERIADVVGSIFE